MKMWRVIFLVCSVVIPGGLFAQTGVAGEIKGLQGVLGTIYEQMLPLCSGLIGAGRAIAGFAALFYIAARVWRHIANAEPIDLFPLLRPFVIGFAILIFPSVIALINGIMQPTVTGTAAMVNNSDAAIDKLLKQKEEAVKNSAFYQMYVGPDGSGDRDKWYQYTHPDDPTGAGEGVFESLGNDIKFAMAKLSYNFRNSIKEWLSLILEVLFEAAALCINTIRTFYLILLAILGPLVFAISVFDGLQHTLVAWIARYINIYLWLPIANIFGSIIGKIQENMIALDINQIQSNGDTYFSSTDTGYLVFLIIGIVGYFTIPAASNYIIHAGGGNMLLYKVSNVFASSSQTVLSSASALARSSGNAIKNYSTDQTVANDGAGNPGYFGKYESSSKDSNSSGGFMSDKLKGNS